MPALPIDALPELPPPRGYVPAAAPLPPTAEPLLDLPLPGDGFGIEGIPAAGAERDALLERLVATAAIARGRMRWADASHAALIGAFAAGRAGDDVWRQRFALEVEAASLFSGDGSNAELALLAVVLGRNPVDEDARAWINRAVQAGLAGDPTRALEHLASAEAALEHGDHYAALLVLANRAQALLDAGDLDAAAREAAAALRLARREKQEYWVALASIGAALVHLARGRRNEARARLGDAARLFARTGDALRQVQCHYLLGELAWSGEDPIRAGSHYRDALAIARPAEAQEWIELLTLRFEHR